TCEFCGLTHPPGGFFCGRCGGELEGPSALGRVLAQVRTARTLVRNRVWTGTADRLRAIGTALAGDPSLAGPAERTLVGLGRDAERLVDAEVELPRTLGVAAAAVEILPAQSFPGLRSH